MIDIVFGLMKSAQTPAKGDSFNAKLLPFLSPKTGEPQNYFHNNIVIEIKEKCLVNRNDFPYNIAIIREVAV